MVKIHSALFATGRPGSAGLDVPENIDDVALWDGTFIEGGHGLKAKAPAPGAPGVAIIAGHVSSSIFGPGAFYDLGNLKVGDAVSVLSPSGRRTTWEVSAPPVMSAKDALPAALFFTTGPPRLSLVTCAGPFDLSTGHYLDNVIVFGKPATGHRR